jgi:hypothetical protein
MDFIFHEIKDAIIQRNTLPYAPYIMLLIKHSLGEYDLSDDCVDHQVKKIYVKKKKTHAPSTAYPRTFMADARSSAPTRAPRATATAMSREVKKLSWFERNVLCMKVEIHRENYQAYVERKTIQDTQQLILHRLSGAQSTEPTPTAATSYEAWRTNRYNWCDMEKHIFAPPDAPVGDAHAEFEEAEEDVNADDAGDDDDAVGSNDFDDWEE